MKKVLKVVTNKYFIASLLFVLWTVFFDQNDWITLQQRQKELNSIKEDIKFLNTEIARMSSERNDLLTNNHKLEQYARENYRMKQEGEDVYVIEQ